MSGLGIRRGAHIEREKKPVAFVLGPYRSHSATYADGAPRRKCK